MFLCIITGNVSLHVVSSSACSDSALSFTSSSGEFCQSKTCHVKNYKAFNDNQLVARNNIYKINMVWYLKLLAIVLFSINKFVRKGKKRIGTGMADSKNVLGYEVGNSRCSKIVNSVKTGNDSSAGQTLCGYDMTSIPGTEELDVRPSRMLSQAPLT